MRKFIIILSILLLALSVEGQSILNAGKYYSYKVAGLVWSEEEYQTVYDAMTNKPTAGVDTAQNAMVKSLVDGGWWARMDVLYIFANSTNNGGEALINWIEPGTNNATDGNSTAFVALEGFEGDGSSDFINTNYNPTTDSVNFGKNDCAFGVYVRDDEATARIFGAYNVAGRSQFAIASSTAAYYVNTDNDAADSQAASNGFWIVTRTSQTSVSLYRGAGAAEDTEATTSTIVPPTDILIHKTATTFGTSQVSLFFVMNAVANQTEAEALNTIFETYMDAIGKGVQ